MEALWSLIAKGMNGVGGGVAIAQASNGGQRWIFLIFLEIRTNGEIDFQAPRSR